MEQPELDAASLAVITKVHQMNTRAALYEAWDETRKHLCDGKVVETGGRRHTGRVSGFGIVFQEALLLHIFAI